jgi:glycosyltransferase involved in cell wall biosynthesis
MPLPRIAVLCAISGMGGAEISLLELVAHLRGSYEFHLIVPGDGPLKRNAESTGAQVWVLPWPETIVRTGETAQRPGSAQMLQSLADLPGFTRRLNGLLDEIGPAALVTNAVKAHIVGALTHRRENVPLIWYVRDGMEERVRSRKLLALLSRRCDVAICISRYVASQFRKYISASVPTMVVYNIVDLKRFHPSAAPPRDLRKHPDELWYGMVGAITPLKGHDVFLDAAEKVLAQLPQAKFVIAGNNPYLTETGLEYEERLRYRVASSLLRTRVKFVGFRGDMPGVFSQLDVLVQSNRGPEGLGRSVLEAMACGVPVIAVNKWGPAELIGDSRSGLLFTPMDTAQLTAHMLTLGESESMRKTMGNRGHDWIQRNLIAAELAKKFDSFLAGAIGSQKELAA